MKKTFFLKKNSVLKLLLFKLRKNKLKLSNTSKRFFIGVNVLTKLKNFLKMSKNHKTEVF